MAKVLAGITFRDPHPALLANADASPITTADACRAELVNHLTTGVDWVGAIRAMHAKGVTTFIEVGPGRVLTGLIRRIAPDAVTLAAGRSGRRRPPQHPVRRRGRGRRRRLRLTRAWPRLAPELPRRSTREPNPKRNHVRQPDFSRRVVVTGLGVISPVGNDKATAWSNLLNGVSGLGIITRFDPSRYDHKVAGEVRDFDPGRGWTPRPCAAARRPCGTASRPRSRRSPTPGSRSPTRTARTSAWSSGPAPAARR